jgi:hypothetical protein
VEIVMRCIVNACMMARASFSEPEEVHRFWRYLNLQHLIAYCGLTDGYNIDNFFGPLVENSMGVMVWSSAAGRGRAIPSTCAA